MYMTQQVTALSDSDAARENPKRMNRGPVLGYLYDVEKISRLVEQAGFMVGI